MFNLYKKSTKRLGNSLAYNISLPVYIFFKIAINTRDVDLRFGFKLCAVAFLCCNGKVELQLFKGLLCRIARTVDMNWDFVLRSIPRAGAVAMVREKASWCVDKF